MEKRNTAGGSAARENPAGERLPESETALKDPTEDRVFCRALLAVTAGALLFAWAVTALHLEPVFFTPCLFHRITGLYCPGCGSGRAVNALFHGRFAEAVSYNILLPILGIPCLFVLAHEYLRIVFPKMKLRPVNISQRTAEILTVVIVVFWILRNVPAFDILAP